MVEYVPPPQDLSKLNPIQRYMQKGSLDFADWLRLGAVILAYWLLRPYFQRLAKKWSDETREGEEETEAYKQRRAAAAVSANDIRSTKKTTDGKTLGELLDQGSDAFLKDSDTKTTAVSEKQDTSEVKNRKKKSKGVSFAPEKSELDKTLDWEDESEFDPRRGPVTAEGGEQPGEIEQWLNKWS